MTDAELRALVREAVARHLGTGATSAGRPSSSRAPDATAPHAPDCGAHPSHDQYVTLVNVGDACVIEPSVTCDHCGYCRSHGH